MPRHRRKKVTPLTLTIIEKHLMAREVSVNWTYTYELPDPERIETGWWDVYLWIDVDNNLLGIANRDDLAIEEIIRGAYAECGIREDSIPNSTYEDML